MSIFTEAQTDAGDLAKLVNEDEEVTTRYGGQPKKSWLRLQAEFEALISALDSSGQYQVDQVIDALESSGSSQLNDFLSDINTDGNSRLDVILNDIESNSASAINAFNSAGVEAINSFNNSGNSAINNFNAEATTTIDALKSSQGFYDAGTFAAGFVYEKFNDVGRDDNGNPWVYIGGDSYPVTVTAGTDPSAFPLLYSQRGYDDHAALANRAIEDAHPSSAITNSDQLTSQDTHDGLKASLQAQGLSGNFGFFADGFTYLEIGDACIDGTGGVWLTSETLPYEVTAGTIPTASNFTEFSTPFSNDIRNKGAAVDGSTNDLAAYQAANNDSKPLGVSLTSAASENTYGDDLAIDSLVQFNAAGRLLNPKSTLNNYFFGMETLQHWFGLFAGSSNQNGGNLKSGKIVCTGDSTTFGVGGTYGGVPAILSELAKIRGYSNVEVVNKGRSGAPLISWPETNRVTSWQANYLNEDIAADPDLLIVRWGANDPFYNVTPLGSSSGSPVNDRDTVLDKVITGYRETLETLRNTAGMGVEDLSVILVTPGPMNDVFFGRDEVYFQRLSIAMKQMALDYKCAFLDAYALYSNSWGGVGDWMDADNTSGTLRAVHPHNELYEHISGAIAEMALPDWGLNWKVNAVRNTSGSSVNRLIADLPNQYYSGINIDRMGDGVGSTLGRPYNGMTTTIKQSDGAALQINYPLKGFGAGVSMRMGFNNSWNGYFNGAVYDINSLVYQNSWKDRGGNFQTGSYKLSLDGTVTMSGIIDVGTSADGTLLFTLPAGFRPGKITMCLVGTDTATCMLTINNNGTVTISGYTTGTYLALNNVSFHVY